MKLLITFHLGNEFKLNPQSTSLPYHITTSPFSKLFHSQLFINSNVTPLYFFTNKNKKNFSQIWYTLLPLYPFLHSILLLENIKLHLNYNYNSNSSNRSECQTVDGYLKSARNGKIPTGKINKKIIIPRKISKDPLKLSRINLETFLLRRIYPSPAPIGSTAGLRIVWIIDGGRGKRGLASTRNKKQDGGHVERADVCAQGGMAAHWSTFGALQRWRGRTGATGGGLQVREGGEGREETNPRGGLERFVFLVFLDPPARSSRSSSWIWTAWPTYPPQGEREKEFEGCLGF